MKRVQLRKYKPKKKTTKYFYDVGRTVDGKPQYSIEVNRKLIYIDSYGMPWLKFPLQHTALILDKGKYKLIPKQNHVVYDFYLIAGLKGDIQLEVNCSTDFSELLLYITEPQDRSKPGFGKGILVCVPELQPVYIHWIRTGFAMTGFLHEGAVQIVPDGKVVKITDNTSV